MADLASERTVSEEHGRSQGQQKAISATDAACATQLARRSLRNSGIDAPLVELSMKGSASQPATTPQTSSTFHTVSQTLADSAKRNAMRDDGASAASERVAVRLPQLKTSDREQRGSVEQLLPIAGPLPHPKEVPVGHNGTTVRSVRQKSQPASASLDAFRAAASADGSTAVAADNRPSARPAARSLQASEGAVRPSASHGAATKPSHRRSAAKDRPSHSCSDVPAIQPVQIQQERQFAPEGLPASGVNSAVGSASLSSRRVLRSSDDEAAGRPTAAASAEGDLNAKDHRIGSTAAEDGGEDTAEDAAEDGTTAEPSEGAQPSEGLTAQAVAAAGMLRDADSVLGQANRGVFSASNPQPTLGRSKTGKPQSAARLNDGLPAAETPLAQQTRCAPDADSANVVDAAASGSRKQPRQRCPTRDSANGPLSTSAEQQPSKGAE